MVFMYARNGLSTAQVAKKLGMGRNAFQNALKALPEARQALKNGREDADILVEDALFQKCIGFTVPVKKYVKLKRITYENGKKAMEEEMMDEVMDEQYIPPSVPAQVFWLKNRCAGAWSDKRGEMEEDALGDYTLEIMGDGDEADDTAE